MRGLNYMLPCRAGWLCVAAAALVSGTSALAQELRTEVRAVVQGAGQGDAQQPEDPARRAVWIGVQCGHLPELLRWQLDLPEDEGVLILDVVPDSPAAEAGLEKHDIIVAAGEKSLMGPVDLLEAVRDAGDGPIEIHYLRKGKRHTVEVKPAPRPEGFQQAPPAADAQDRVLSQWLAGLNRTPFNMRVFQPGMVLPPGVKAKAPLPKGMSVNVFKEGGDAAKITVKRGDDTWEVDEESLSKLPDDVRRHVEAMLGHMAIGHMANGAYNIRVLPPATFTPTTPVPSFGDALSDRLEKMDRQLEQLREAIEKLQDESSDKQ